MNTGRHPIVAVDERPGLSGVWRLFSPVHRRRLLLSVPAAILAAGLSVAVVLAPDPVYRSQAVVLIDQPRLEAATDQAGVVPKLGSLRFKYAAIARTTQVIGPVADQLGLSQAEVRRRANVEIPQDALVLLTTAETPDRQSAPRIAQAVAERLVSYASEDQTAAGIAEPEQVRLTVVQPALGAAKLAPSTLRAVLVALAIGAVTLVLSYLGFQMLGERRTLPV